MHETMLMSRMGMWASFLMGFGMVPKRELMKITFGGSD